MKLSLLAVALLVGTAVAAPIPKSVVEAEAQKYAKLRAEYDQQVATLGDSSQGIRLRLEMGEARTLAGELISMERDAARERLREGIAKHVESLTPREQELVRLHCYELRRAKR